MSRSSPPNWPLLNKTLLNLKTMDPQFSLNLDKLLIGVFLSFFVILTICGNFLVIFAVIRERYLRTITNYFIVSLATADLFMGAVVMPFSVILIITDDYWPFGQVWCDLWHALDVLSSTASILNLCMIALERYWATENPITYTTRVTQQRCLIIVMCVWICSSAISFPAIIWWRAVSPQTPQSFRCLFTDNTLYLISSSVVSFYGPLVVMIVVYYRIYKTATNLIRSLNAGTKVIYKNGQQGEPMVLRIHRGGMQDGAAMNSHHSKLANSHSCSRLSAPDAMRPSFYSSAQHLPISHNEAEQASSSSGIQSSVGGHHLLSIPNSTGNALRPPTPALRSNSLCLPVVSTSRRGSICAGATTNEEENNQLFNSSKSVDLTGSASKSIANKLRHFEVGKRLSKFAREQKAAKTLGIVMGIFIICWLPFFVCNIITAFDMTHVSNNTIKFVTWLGYINSSVNPIVYAHSMRDFRRAFIKLLCSWYFRRRSASLDDKLYYRSGFTPSTSAYFRRNSARPFGDMRRASDIPFGQLHSTTTTSGRRATEQFLSPNSHSMAGHMA